MKKYLYHFISRFMAFVLLSLFMMPCAATAGAEGTLSSRALAMINKPGVVLVQTVWTADITLNEFSILDSFEDDLLTAVTAMVEDGTVANDTNSIYSAMVQLIIQYMADYIYTTGNVFTETSSTAAIGTGFIVTPDGYLVTNAHVVNTDQEQLTYDFAVSALQSYAVEGTNGFITELKSQGYEMSQEEIDGMLNAFYNILAANLSINNLKTSYCCYMGNVTPGSDVSAKGVLLDLRTMGEPIPGKDVAILKIEKTNLPTVTLGDDSKLRTGDQVYAMGYPAVATVNDALNVAQAIQEPTMTSGIISARKEMAGGWNILQTDADIHGGNSGGPLFNEAGEVIGINTFGTIDPNSGAMVSGMNFAVPISIAKQFLNEINVTPSESKFTTNYKKAVSLFESKNYSEALDILRSLNETNPGYPVVADLLAEASTMAEQQPKSDTSAAEKSESAVTEKSSKTADKNTNEKEKEAVSTTAESEKEEFPILWVVIAAASVVVLLLIIVIIILATRRKTKPNPNRYDQNMGYAAPPSAPMNNRPMGNSGMNGSAMNNPGMYNTGRNNSTPDNPAMYNTGMYNPAANNKGMNNSAGYNPAMYNTNRYNSTADNPAMNNSGIYNNPAVNNTAANNTGSNNSAENNPESGMIHCTNCGKALPSGTKFCNNCGAKITE